MRIYSAPVLAQVTHIKHVLEMHDIACYIQGEYRSGAAGALPPTETWPELWVVDLSNVEEAKRLVAEALAPAGPAPPGWTCGKGRWVDNVFVERLWRSVKYEDVYLHAYETPASLRAGLTRYFQFYNGRRRHSSLGRRTPDVVYFDATSFGTAA